LCNKLLHNFISYAVGQVKRPHEIQVTPRKPAHAGECYAQIVAEAVKNGAPPADLLLPLHNAAPDLEGIG
jgi:hypothetical protein